MGNGNPYLTPLISDTGWFTMNWQLLAPFAVILLMITSIGVLISRDWRIIIAYFSAQYLGVLVLVGINWPLQLAIIKLIVGWMAGAVLGTTQIGQKKVSDDHSWPAGRMFRVLAAGLVIILLYVLTPQIPTWFPGANLWIIRGSLILIAMGLLQLGMTSRPFRVIVGLMTVLSGFEIIYSVVESSILVAGLLAAVNFGMALLGSYFLSISTPEELA